MIKKNTKKLKLNLWYRELFTVMFLSCFSLAIFAQQGQVKGLILDVHGDPIVGASVLEKGTSNGTISDLDGNFSFNMRSYENVISISYLGYQSQEVKVAKGEVLNIILEEDKQLLDEVVVVGYGVQKKSDVTGSVASVSKERLENIPVSNVLQAVQGSTAGVNITQVSSIPGESPSTMIRGQNSINAGTGPYIVVDGIPISKSGGSLNDISPNDVESIEILKDASAVAIYGTNGANGVILVTTKRGSGKPTIRYNGYLGIEGFAHIPEMTSAEELLARYAEGHRINGSPMYHEVVKYENEVENYEKGITRDWIDEVKQTGIITDNNISISGGNDNAKYYVSAAYMDQKGVVKGYNYKRYSFRTNLDVNVTNYMTVGTNSYIVSHNRDGGRANLLNAAAMSPYAKMYNDDGSLCVYPMHSETLWANPLLPTTTNPERRQWNISINGYADLDFGKIWEPLKGFKYKFNAGYSYVPRRSDSYSGMSMNDLLGTAERRNFETQNYTVENIITYVRDFGKHHMDLTGLYAASRKKYTETSSKSVDFVNDVLGWHNLGAGATQSVGSYTDRYATCSQMGRINYSYDSRYLATFTVRRDGSSVFGHNNKYGTFPSFALGWNVTNESFMEKSLDWLNNLKFRLSYGKSGNEAISVYQAMTKMASRSIPFDGLLNIGMQTETLGNDDLTWETTKSFNLGIDFGLFNNRINGAIDIYVARTSDLLLNRQIPKITGFGSVLSNMGKTQNKGIEFTLNTRNIVLKDFQWSSDIVFSWNKNKIKDLYGDKKSDRGNRWFIGEPIGVIFDYEKVGIWQEDEIEAGLHKEWDPIAKAGDVKLKDQNGDGQITDEDRKILGQTVPKWTGGLTNTFTWKDLTLSVFLQTVQGAKRNNASIGMASDELERRTTFAEIGYWTPENKSNEWRSLNKNSNPHGYGFPYKNNYTRIKDVTLSYNFPKVLTNKMGLGSLQVYASGRNLYTFTNWIGWDPEERDIARGLGNSEINYPGVRSIVFGINVTL